MISLLCRFPDCRFSTDELPESLAVSVLNSHTLAHVAPRAHNDTNLHEKTEELIAVSEPVTDVALEPIVAASSAEHEIEAAIASPSAKHEIEAVPVAEPIAEAALTTETVTEAPPADYEDHHETPDEATVTQMMKPETHSPLKDYQEAKLTHPDTS